MSAALDEACKALNLGPDNLTRAIVAQTIIALVEEGQTATNQLAAAVVKEMRGPKPV